MRNIDSSIAAMTRCIQWMFGCENRRRLVLLLLHRHQTPGCCRSPLGMFHFLLWLLALLNVNIITVELYYLTMTREYISIHQQLSLSHVVNDIDKMLLALTKCLYSILAIENTAQWSSQCYMSVVYKETYINGSYQIYIFKDPLL